MVENSATSNPIEPIDEPILLLQQIDFEPIDVFGTALRLSTRRLLTVRVSDVVEGAELRAVGKLRLRSADGSSYP